MTLETRKERDAGFTLLEMMVVLVIAGLLIGLVLTRGPLRNDAMTFSDGQLRILSALQAARREAVLHGKDVTFELDTRTHIVSVTDGAFAVTSDLRTPVQIRDEQNKPIITARFFADGSAQEASFLLRYGRYAARVTLSALTGRIQVQN
ncbi:hypothetical protein AA106555_0942 [Neokomagataea thailandica NBRC 106555]|uniref:Type II secretion system protein H n=2 Tax=Neokomagataea TaxID=1223423 RepID=A0A4Y6V9H9_9PROT|nr:MULTISPECIES: GspH/FimT family pseudopilin [Neokomagataea]QDH25320.1 prepilin-type N-terminal cleavage/methylation domain-containing protein [Neokomagataea tanensis]GBR52510.1 hypothetical protein AA106555_0942 [Neokomagataea thailandica NBRC 106555]